MGLLNTGTVTIFIIVLSVGYVISEELITVNIGNKLKITGKKFDVPDIQEIKDIYQFLGIKYARIPRRFARAEQTTEGIINATNPGPVCYQNPKPLKDIWEIKEIPKMSEDCLYLNIWTPTLDSNAKLPVLFYIHGGSFANGFGYFHKGDILTSLHDIVFVSINYRLYSLGFFSTGDDVVPGNLGLLDQLDALRWVNRNIVNFGGDPGKVTLTGLSSGSMSVSYHIVSPLSKGLFKRAIMQSGSSISRFGRTRKESHQDLERIAKVFKIQSADSAAVLAKFKQMDAQTLVNQSLAFPPVVDNYFVPDLPVNLYNKDKFSHVDIIAGYTENDGYLFMSEFAKNILKINTIKPQPGINITKENLIFFLDLFFSLVVEMKNKDFLELVYEEYVGDNVGFLDKFRTTEVAFRDLLSAAATFEGAQKHSRYNNVYVYEYDHRQNSSVKPPWVVADHGDDTQMPTGDCLRKSFDKLCNNEDKEVSKMIMQYWVNFATNGNPNGRSVTYWPRYTCKTQNYLELDKYPRVEAVFNPERVRLWMETMFKMDSQREGVYVARNNPCVCNNAPGTSMLSVLLLNILMLLFTQ